MKLRDLFHPIVGRAGMPDPRKWSVHGESPQLVLAPEHAEQVSAILSLASRDGLIVESAGMATRLESGRPQAVDLVMSMHRMTGIVAHEPADLTASIAAGTKLKDAQNQLAAADQWIALDPPQATIGGFIAAAGAGPLRLGYGTPRDHVLGLQVVTGDGRILNLGGRVVKNVAGYDLVKLIVGSRGTLGVVTQAHMRLRARPVATATVAIVAGAPGPLIETMDRLRDARIEPAALELLSPIAARDVLRTPLWTLLVALHGSEAGVAAAAAGTRAAAPAGTEVHDLRSGTGAWKQLQQLEAKADVVLRLASLPGSLASVLDAAESIAGTRGAIAVHAGSGIARVMLPQTEMDESRVAAVQATRLRVGSLTVARCPGTLAQLIEPLAQAGARRALYRGIKKVFDPADILAPGRYFV